MERNQDVIDLGAVSDVTKGPSGNAPDDKLGQGQLGIAED